MNGKKWATALSGAGAMAAMLLSSTGSVYGQQFELSQPPVLKPQLTGEALMERLRMRPLKRPSNPEASAMVINLLSRYANDAPDKTETDKAIAARLDARPGSREAVRELLARFQALPEATRKDLLGSHLQLVGTRQSDDKIRNVFQRAYGNLRPAPSFLEAEKALRESESLLKIKSANPKKAPTGKPDTQSEFPEGEQQSKSFSTGTQVASLAPLAQSQVRIRYRGLQCVEESDWDQFSSEDEIYVLTSVIDPNTRRQVGDEMRHPIGSQTHYTDVDSGENRIGPAATCYAGAARDVSLIVTVMEHDFTDPNAMRRYVDTVVEAACAAFTSYTGIPVPDFIKGWIGDALDWLFDFEDDEISTEYVSLSASQLNSLAASTRRTAPFSAQFATRHLGDGAHFKCWFEVVR